MPPLSKSQTQIAKFAKCSRTTVYRIQKELSNLGYLKRNQSGQITFEGVKRIEFTHTPLDETKFKENQSILEFLKRLEKSKVVDPDRYLRRLFIICETLQIEPEALHSNITEVEKLKDMFEAEYKKGNAKYLVRNQNTRLNKENTEITHYVKAITMFRERFGLETPTGYLTTYEETFDAYKRINLNDTEKQKGIEFMRQFGEPFVTLFVLHHELGVRIKTLLNLRPVFERKTTDVDGNTCEYYVCYPHETKQSHDYEKPIITPEARQIVSTLQNGKPLHNTTDVARLKLTYNKYLRLFYQSIGRIELDQDGNPKPYKKGTQEYYHIIDPSHVIRHSCIHWLMRMTGYRSNVVASFFWDSPDTLAVYKKTTLAEIMNQGLCDYCTPASQPDPNYKQFCTLRHALAFMNGFTKNA